MDSFINNCLEKVPSEANAFKKYENIVVNIYFRTSWLSFYRHALFDLLIAMVKYASKERLQQLFSMAIENLQVRIILENIPHL
jgi:hypothetical protein